MQKNTLNMNTPLFCTQNMQKNTQNMQKNTQNTQINMQTIRRIRKKIRNAHFEYAELRHVHVLRILRTYTLPTLLMLDDLLSTSRLLEMTTVTFSSDSSRKWQSQWPRSVTQNLSRRWLRAIWSSDAEERLPLFQDVIMILFRRQQSLTADSLI